MSFSKRLQHTFKLRKTLLAWLLCLPGTAQAITIELNYDYDNIGFFNQTGAKEAMRAVADYYESLINDQLLAIDPSEFPGGSWVGVILNPSNPNLQIQLENLVIPENHFILYVGGSTQFSGGAFGGPGTTGVSSGFPMTSSQFQLWRNRVQARGQNGALNNPATDFGPWGGFIGFNANISWNFSTTQRVSNPAFDFVSIALHEMGHVLGLGTSPSWNAKISGGSFTGNKSNALFRGPVPLNGADTTHWRDNNFCQFNVPFDPSSPLNVLSKRYGSFGSSHGADQIALMDPSLCFTGPDLLVMTSLDLAALQDIGWEIRPPLSSLQPKLSRSNAPNEFLLEWNSFGGFYYQAHFTPDFVFSSIYANNILGDGSRMALPITTTTPQGFFSLAQSPTTFAPSSFLQAPTLAEPSLSLPPPEQPDSGTETIDTTPQNIPAPKPTAPICGSACHGCSH